MTTLYLLLQGLLVLFIAGAGRDDHSPPRVFCLAVEVESPFHGVGSGKLHYDVQFRQEGNLDDLLVGGWRGGDDGEFGLARLDSIAQIGEALFGGKTQSRLGQFAPFGAGLDKRNRRNDAALCQRWERVPRPL